MLGRPRMPRACLAAAEAAWLRTISLSEIASIRPAPNTGVGMRKITLWLATWVAKSGWPTLQFGTSAWPLIVNSACTPPSGVPSALRTNRASRTGPLRRTNEGTRLAMPFLVANATCGLTAGLVPPTAGCAWQPPQLSRFIVGPKPSSTSSASLKSSLPATKAAICAGVNPANGAPEAAVPVLGPGSRAEVGGGVSALPLVALGNSRSSTTAEPALGMLLSTACPSVAGSDPPPLQASKPALATTAMSGYLMVVLLHGTMKRRRQRTLRAFGTRHQSAHFVNLACNFVSLPTRPYIASTN